MPRSAKKDERLRIYDYAAAWTRHQELRARHEALTLELEAALQDMQAKWRDCRSAPEGVYPIGVGRAVTIAPPSAPVDYPEVTTLQEDEDEIAQAEATPLTPEP